MTLADARAKWEACPADASGFRQLVPLGARRQER